MNASHFARSLYAIVALAAGGALPACALAGADDGVELSASADQSTAALEARYISTADLPASIPTITTDGSPVSVARTPKSKTYPSGLSAVAFHVSRSGEYSAKVSGIGANAEVYAFLVEATPVDGKHKIVAKLTWRADIRGSVLINESLSMTDYILAFRDASYRKTTSFEVSVSRENAFADVAAVGPLVCARRTTGSVQCTEHRLATGYTHPVRTPPVGSAQRLRSKGNAIIAETTQGIAYIADDRSVRWLPEGAVDMDWATAEVPATPRDPAFRYEFDCTTSGRMLNCEGAAATSGETLKYVHVSSFSYADASWETGRDGSMSASGYVVSESGSVYPWSFLRTIPYASGVARKTTLKLSATASAVSTMVHDMALLSAANEVRAIEGTAWWLPAHALGSRPRDIWSARFDTPAYDRQWAVLQADGTLQVLGTTNASNGYRVARTPAVLATLPGVTFAAASTGAVCGSDGAFIKCLNYWNEWQTPLGWER